MKDILNRLINYESISAEEAKNTLIEIAKGNFNASQVAAFLTVYMMRSITLQELQGFRDALLEMCIHVDFSEYNTIDLCGTGGDGKNTFNISTLASFIVAGTGIKVAKHGNYGVSSVSGSSNVLEYLGVNFTNNTSKLKKCLEEANICVLHAPLFHPAMKQVAPIRKELGVKTFFNMLGPMVNPSFPANQMVGVFNLELARVYSYLYQQTNKSYAILHDLQGYDELSLTGNAKIISNTAETVLSAKNFKTNTITPQDLFGGNTVKDAAKIFSAVLHAEGTEAQTKVVCANAALAIATAKHIALDHAYQLAQESLQSKNALNAFKKMLAICN